MSSSVVSTPIRVLFIEIYSDGSVGGSHSTLFNLVTQLDRSRFKPTVAFYSKNIYSIKLEQCGIDVKILEQVAPSEMFISIIRKAVNWYRMIYRRIEFLKKFYLDEKCDIVVINNTLYTALPYVIAAKKAGVPIIIYERGLNKFSKAELNVSSYISASIAVSDAVLDSLMRQRIKSERVIRIYDGIPKPNVAIDSSVSFDEYSIPSDAHLVGIIGNIKPWKGQRFFIEAVVRLMPRFEKLYGLVIGGCADRDVSYLKELQSMVKNQGLESRILFLGYRTDVPILLRSLDVFVHASTKPEPFGMVIPEAMAARVPVVATNFGGPPESLDYGRCGILVKPEDSHEIAKAISLYLLNDGFREKVISMAYERYKKYFMLEKNVRLVEDLFYEVYTTRKETKDRC